MPTKKTHSESTVKSKPSVQKLHFAKREAINFGFNVAKKNIMFFLTIFVISALVIIVSQVVRGIFINNNAPFLALVFNLVVWVLNTIISMGFINIALKFIDKEKPKLGDLFYTKSIINYIFVSIVRSVIVLVGAILLIIPGIIFSIKFQFATYLVIDKNMGVVDSLNKSWEMTKGVKWNLFLLSLILIGINILGFLAFLIGLVISVPLSMVATAFVYRKLLAQVS